MGAMHAILREICPLKISTPKGWPRPRRHSLNLVNIDNEVIIDNDVTIIVYTTIVSDMMEDCPKDRIYEFCNSILLLMM